MCESASVSEWAYKTDNKMKIENVKKDKESMVKGWVHNDKQKNPIENDIFWLLNVKMLCLDSTQSFTITPTPFMATSLLHILSLSLSLCIQIHRKWVAYIVANGKNAKMPNDTCSIW